MSKIYGVGWDLATDLDQNLKDKLQPQIYIIFIYFFNLMNKYKPLKAYFIQIRSIFYFFRDEFIANASNIRSVLDYNVNITKLPPDDQFYVALTGNNVNLNRNGKLINPSKL